MRYSLKPTVFFLCILTLRKTYFFVVALGFFLVFHSQTFSVNRDLPVYDVNLSCDLIGIASHFKFKRGFYYNATHLAHIDCQRDSTLSHHSVFNKTTTGIGYRYLSRMNYVFGVYGLSCVNSNFMCEDSQNALYSNKTFSSIVIGVETLIHRLHTTINFYIPKYSEYGNGEWKRQYKLQGDLGEKGVGVDITMKRLKSPNHWFPTVSIGGYFLRRGWYSRLFLGFAGHVEYPISSHMTFVAKLTIDTKEENFRYTMGVRYQNYDSTKYTTYQNIRHASKLLHIPVQHSDFSYTSVAP